MKPGYVKYTIRPVFPSLRPCLLSTQMVLEMPRSDPAITCPHPSLAPTFPHPPSLCTPVAGPRTCFYVHKCCTFITYLKRAVACPNQMAVQFSWLSKYLNTSSMSSHTHIKHVSKNHNCTWLSFFFMLPFPTLATTQS